ncbi:hypothetical protein CS542_01030 [Pedobacter sp. IW39]|nr:hypothetical protein CS542_01030 [Pedobacter sp. IW39]
MDMQADALIFKPFIPEVLKGERTLTNFKYRNAVLDIKLNGYGKKIKSITIDGKPLPQAMVPATLKGRHQLILCWLMINQTEVKLQNLKTIFYRRTCLKREQPDQLGKGES